MSNPPSASAGASARYTGTAKALHWSVALLWMAAWCMGFAAVHWRDSVNPHHGLTTAHKAIAGTILFLVAVRIAWRLTHPAPPLPATMSPRMRQAAHAGHVVLYVFAMVGLPLSGWVWSSVADKPIMLLWFIHLPPLTAPHPDAYAAARLVHVAFAWSMGAMVAGHVLLALKHHFVDRDGVLTGMLPGGVAPRR